VEQESDQGKKLVLVSSATMEQMLDKGNVWYVRHYEAYFDRVYIVYFVGSCHEPVTNGATTLLSLGTGRTKIDLLLAPYRLHRLAREINPTSYLTADLVYSWWTCLLVRIFLNAKIFLMPVCIPEEIYESTGKSMSGFLPIWMERIFLKLGFAFYHRVLTCKNAKTYIDWLSSETLIRHKLVVVDTIVEELPSIEFYKCLAAEDAHQHSTNGFSLLYVGRLNKEKMVDDVIRMLQLLRKKELRVHLTIIGDGPERQNLERLAAEIGVRDAIDFAGFIKSEDLVGYYRHADVFVSPLTGTSLREAALCGTAVAAYEMDWVKGFLMEGENALLAEPKNVVDLAAQVTRLLNDKPLREKIASNLQKLALECWRPEKVRDSMKQAFERY
jgi:glycosyltransferase involved in cell wall biosynthesis